MNKNPGLMTRSLKQKFLWSVCWLYINHNGLPIVQISTIQSLVFYIFNFTAYPIFKQHCMLFVIYLLPLAHEVYKTEYIKMTIQNINVCWIELYPTDSVLGIYNVLFIFYNLMFTLIRKWVLSGLPVIRTFRYSNHPCHISSDKREHTKKKLYVDCSYIARSWYQLIENSGIKR